MQLNEKLVEKYKGLVLKEAFKDTDPKQVTDEMVRSTMDKGWMACPSKDKLVCFTCGSFVRMKPEEVVQDSHCPICITKFSV